MRFADESGIGAMRERGLAAGCGGVVLCASNLLRQQREVKTSRTLSFLHLLLYFICVDYYNRHRTFLFVGGQAAQEGRWIGATAVTLVTVLGHSTIHGTDVDRRAGSGSRLLLYGWLGSVPYLAFAII